MHKIHIFVTIILLPFQLKLEKAQEAKAKGNKFFKGGRYDLAIECYTEAIRVCPDNQASDLATFHQNRAAAYEQLVSTCNCYLKSYFIIEITY